LSKLRPDVLGCDSFKVGSAASTLQSIAGEKIHLGADVSLQNEIFAAAFLRR
jgi:hypothetical protein